MAEVLVEELLELERAPALPGVGRIQRRIGKALLERGDDARGVPDRSAVDLEHGEGGHPAGQGKRDKHVGPGQRIAADVPYALVVERPARLLVEVRELDVPEHWGLLSRHRSLLLFARLTPRPFRATAAPSRTNATRRPGGAAPQTLPSSASRTCRAIARRAASTSPTQYCVWHEFEPDRRQTGPPRRWQARRSKTHLPAHDAVVGLGEGADRFCSRGKDYGGAGQQAVTTCRGRR